MMLLPSWVQRGIAVALALGAILFIWAVGVVPVFTKIAADRAAIGQAQLMLARASVVDETLPVLEKRLATARRVGALDPGFLMGTNPEIVAAQLQDTVRQIAGAAGVSLRSSQTLDPTPEAGFLRIGLTLELGASAAGLERVLYQLETAQPRLFVDQFSVRLPEDGSAPIGPDGQPQFTVRLTVSGYQRGTGS